MEDSNLCFHLEEYTNSVMFSDIYCWIWQLKHYVPLLQRINREFRNYWEGGKVNKLNPSTPSACLHSKVSFTSY